MALHKTNSAARAARMWAIAGAVVGITYGAVACSDTTASGRRPVSVAFQVGGGSASGSISAGMLKPSMTILTEGGHTLDVQSVDVTFDKVMLGRLSADDDTDSESEDAEVENPEDSETDSESDASDRPVKLGASTVSLPLDGGLVNAFSGQVPVGTYDRLKMAAKYVRIRGTYDGNAFDVTVPVNAMLHVRISPPLTVTDATATSNVTVDIDVMDWFRTNGGALIDPREINSSNTIRQEFRRNIRDAFKAFKDFDHDGDDEDSDDSDGTDD